MKFSLGTYVSEGVSSPFSTLIKGGGRRGAERGGRGKEKQNNVMVNIYIALDFLMKELLFSSENS